ncbi:tubulin-like doman-containing protein, partial [Planctomycetota bacterium]
MRLNGLMAEDPYWRWRIARDIYYVLLDTELAIIDEFQATVDRQLAGVDKPLIRSLRIAQGHVILQPLVNRFFVRPFEDMEDTRGRERLYDHWWHHSTYGPFTAPKVRPLTRGAGQCPAASYFLTWNSLRSVEDVFDRLMDELKTRRAAEAAADTPDGDLSGQLNFCIIAGLAGGTGRGAWQLIAFKVREVLMQKHGVIPSPVAFLFDASTFENIYRKYPRQEVPLKVNSLTGVSELSCWMEKSGQAPTKVFPYKLPSMDSPHDEHMDVLSIDLSLDRGAAAPVDNAFLIFGGNKMAVLADNVQYHEMVGTGLYAALSRSAILSSQINEQMPYVSLGTSTFEVNAVTLRRYFEGLSRISVVQRLAGSNDKAVNHAVDEFMRACHLRIGITAEKRAAYLADAKGNVMQRACHCLMESDEIKFDLAALAKALESDVPEAVEHAVSQLVEPRDQLAETSVAAAVGSLARQPEDVAKACVEGLLRDTRSVETVRRFVEKATNRMEYELSALPAPARMQVSRDDDPTVLVHEYKGREYFGLFGPHFNPDECNDLQDQTRNAVLYANYQVLCEQVSQRYKTWVKLISRWKTSADMILATADKLTAKFNNELQDDLGTSGGEADDFFDALFADAACPERSTPEEFARGRFYRRDLKPVLKRGQDLKMLGEPKFKKELSQVISQAVLDGSLSQESYDELDKLRRDLEAAIRRTVHLEPRFIEKNFSIRNVIVGLRRPWIKRFDEAKGTGDELQKLINRFETFFGVKVSQDDQEFTLPSDDDFILQMGASLVATCRPYWQLTDKAMRDARRAKRIARVSLFLPVLGDSSYQEYALNYITKQLGEANVTAEVFTERDLPSNLGDSRANPFLMLANSIDGADELGDIASLDYWKSPLVKESLTKCEDVTGMSVFDEVTQHNGISYTDPAFIRDDRLREKRWKPWIDKDAGATVRRDETGDALLYALMVPDKAFREEKLAPLGWTTPLIHNSGQRWYEFTRRAMRWNAGQPCEDIGCPWKARDTIAQGLRQVFDVLAGEGRPDGTLKLEGQRWCQRIRQEAREFWEDLLRGLKAPKGSELYEKVVTD